MTTDDRVEIGASIVITALAVVAALFLIGCSAAARTVALTATTATVRSVDAALVIYESEAVKAEHTIAVEAIAACHGTTAPDAGTVQTPAYAACLEAYVVPRRAPWDRLRVAVLGYKAAAMAGGDVAGGHLGAALGTLLGSFGAVGIRVQP